MTYRSTPFSSLTFALLSLSSAACHHDDTSDTGGARTPVEAGDAAAGQDASRIIQVDAADQPGADGAVDAPRDAGSDASVQNEAGSDMKQDAAPSSDAASDAAPAGDAASDAAISDPAIRDAASAAPDDAAGKQLVLGNAHGCSLDPAISGVVCWGDNRRGQTRVPSTLKSPRAVAAGGDTTCAIDGEGSVSCWGDDTHGQLDVPAGLGRATQVAVGQGHACALAANGTVRCWGDNSSGQLTVPSLGNVRALGAGVRHSCALTTEGVRCWGDNAQGQLDAPMLAGATQLAIGSFHGCASGAGRVACWGGSVPALREAPGLGAPTAIAAGNSHTCAIDGGRARCWGDPAARDLTPRELTWPRQIAVGSGELAFACARHQQGVSCWGDDSLGQTRYSGYPLHILYRAEAQIAAPPDVIWSVLMDLDHYGAWNPYTIAMRSTLKLGDPMIMTVKMNDLLTIEQTENIRVLEPGHKVCWGIETTTPELNSGERCQWLEPLPNGGTRYVTEDLIEGALNPIVLGLFDNDLQLGFDGVARGLKARAEALYTP